MQWNPYLAFNGECEEAFKFYERCLGGKIVAMIPLRRHPIEEHMPAGPRAGSCTPASSRATRC